MMTKQITKSAIIFLILFLNSSCHKIFKDFKNNNKGKKVRFVSLEGKSRDIDLRTPPQNVEILNEQGRLSNRVINPPKQGLNQKNQISENKYATNSAQQELERTLSLPTDNSRRLPNNNRRQSTEIVAQNAGNKPDSAIVEELKLEEQPEVILSLKKSKTDKIKQEKTVSSGIYVQTGSFRNESGAKTQLRKISKLPFVNNIKIQNAYVKGKKYYRVLVGPFNNKKTAKLETINLKNKGHKSIIVKIR